MSESRKKPASRKFVRTLIYAFLFFPAYLSGQKFHFQDYNVQQGLIQSQVHAITQDHFDNLWFCTLGGISRFDGKVFTNFSETDGLISNYANSILADHDSNIWIGTLMGVSRFNGKVFRNILLEESSSGNMVRSIVEDGARRIWIHASGRLYRMDAGDKPVRISITGLKERITAIQVDKQGQMMSAVFGEGVFRLENGTWKKIISLPGNDEKGYCQKMFFDAVNPDRLYLLMSDELMVSEKGMVRTLVPAGSLGMCINAYADRSGKIWLAGSRGLYQLTESGLVSVNRENGFEGTKTSVIYQDREDNIWLGTDGTGVFRYSYQPFLIFDQFSAGQNRSIMPILQDKNKFYLGTAGSGLYQYDGKNVSAVKGFSKEPWDQNIIGLFPGRENEIYVLASSSLLKKYSNGKFTDVQLGGLKECINAVIPGEQGGFWVASCRGFFNVSPAGKSTLVFNNRSERVLRISKDSLLVSTDGGLYLVANDFKYRKIDDPLLNKASYMSLGILGKYFLLATSNKGFIIYNPATGKRHQYTTREGMNADFIYSVVTDHHNQIWLGTGRGVNKVIFDTVSETIQITSLSIPGDISSAECNQGGAFYDDQKNVWIGTVSGLFKYYPDSASGQKDCPPVILQEVQVFSKEVPHNRYTGFLDNWYSIPKDLSLAHNENHLSFSFRCPSYLHSESILYQYQLEGLEKNYSALTPNHYVVYPALPPGHYRFRVRAWLEGQGFSKENVDFSFDIRAAFYQTIYFKFLVLVLLMGMILWIQWLRMRMRARRIHQIEEIKREENIKVRQTASEDFHDEVGNSLTRIQVLTDVLHSKLGNGHEEEKRLIGQIKENVSGLYQGTRDILWALNPESDMVREIGHRLESLGIDVFQDTGICFTYDNLLGEAENLRLPGNFNRNIMMIYKEAMSNCLKHAKATKVKLTIQTTEIQEIRIELADDGIGFNPLYIKKGHGFQNMQKRANRMKAQFSISSQPGEGTRYELRIPVSVA